MPAGPARWLALDDRLTKSLQWQLLKVPGGQQTLVTAAKLSQSLKNPGAVSFAEDNFDFADVSLCQALMVQIWGEAADTHAPVVNLYGWNDNGPGIHIGTVTATFGAVLSEDINNAAPGWHTSTNLPAEMRAAFPAATDFRGCDTYVITADYMTELFRDDLTVNTYYQSHKVLSAPSAIGTPGAPDTSPEDDHPSYFIVDLSRAWFRYLCVACTALNSATSVGAIFRPVSLR